MNILPLVFAILFILMLYTQLQVKQMTQLFVVKNEYKEYVTHEERNFFNEHQEKLYDNFNKKIRKERERIQESRTYNKGINFRLILNKKIRNSQPNLAKQHRLILKELMRVLLEENSLYKKLNEKRDDPLEDLINDLIASADVQFEKDTFGVEEVDKLQLQDPELAELFYHMKKEILREVADKIVKDDDEEDEENIVIEQQDNEVQKTISLKDFMHFFDRQTKIQVYGCYRELLVALFDKETADKIIKVRNEIYSERKKMGDQYKTIGSQKFEEFKKYKKTWVADDVLDFTVSGSNPKILGEKRNKKK